MSNKKENHTFLSYRWDPESKSWANTVTLHRDVTLNSVGVDGHPDLYETWHVFNKDGSSWDEMMFGGLVPLSARELFWEKVAYRFNFTIT